MAGFVLSVSSIILFLWGGAAAATLTISNNCAYTVWPGVASGAGTAQLPTTGFALQTGESRSLDVPSGWSGNLWGRTFCATDSSGRFSCATGDCGSGAMACSGRGVGPPATLAEFTLNGSDGKDFYDVSLVDGYNLPMLIDPQGGAGGACSSTGCAVDINGLCPSDLRVVLASSDGGSESVACRSACQAFGSPEYCCSGEYGNPNTCKPSSYSQLFKHACPRAYSYAFDDATSTFTCTSASYRITFCPATASQKSSDPNPEAAGIPSSNSDGTMVYIGGKETSGAEPSLAARLWPIIAAVSFALLSLPAF